MRYREALLRWPLVLASFLASTASARADDCLGPGHVEIVTESERDAATLSALEELLASDVRSGAAVWRLTLAGPRATVRHRGGDQFGRTLDGTAYARALAAAELLNAARAAVCGTEEASTSPSPPPVGAPPSISLAVGVGGRFDADIDGPWLVRPTAFLDLSLLRDAAVFLSLTLEGSALGTHTRGASQRGEASVLVRYERHDVALGAGIGLRLGSLTLAARFLVGVSVRDVTALSDDVTLAHRLDVGATLGGALSVRVPLLGPIGLRLAADLMGVPEGFGYRARGEPVVVEAPVRIGTLVGLDLEWL